MRGEGVLVSTRRVAVIYGTRPEAVKVAPLVFGVRQHDHLEPFVIATGQHRDLLDQVNGWFDIEPDADLDLMAHGATLSDLSARALRAVTAALDEHQPDVVVVQGDTTSAFIAGLAAFYLGIPVAHLEAGLRSGDIRSPFPEEANRRLLSTVADLHLAPTQASRQNLEQEGIDPASITVTGNTVIDALRWTTNRPVQFSDPAVQSLVRRAETGGSRLMLVTAHRRESWGDPMRQAMRGVLWLLDQHPDLEVLFPVHPNPKVRDVVAEVLGGSDRVLLTTPMDYPEFAHAMSASTLVLTDSGGVQEEAPSLGKPVLVMRDTTERPEAVQAGTVALVGTSEETVRDTAHELLSDPTRYARMSRAVNPYGDGVAAPRAVAAIAAMLGVGDRLPEFDPAEDA